MDRSRLLAQLKRQEGEVLHAYEDSMGYWTIGVGRLIDERRGGGISPEESQYLLSNDVTRTQASVAARFAWYAALDDAHQNVADCSSKQPRVTSRTPAAPDTDPFKRSPHSRRRPQQRCLRVPGTSRSASGRKSSHR